MEEPVASNPETLVPMPRLVLLPGVLAFVQRHPYVAVSWTLG